MKRNIEGPGVELRPGADPAGRAAHPLEHDARLLEGVRRGDDSAIAALYERFAGLVYSVALRVLRDQSSAEDVLQDVFITLWRQPESFTAVRNSLGGWLSLVARHRAVDSLRRKRPSEQIAEVFFSSSFALSGDALSSGPERNSLTQKARSVLARLPPEQRKTLQWAFFDGLTHTEIAEITGDPVGTVKTRIRTALLSLRKELEA
jgi:RNA polymerase sigma-70 factor (ECF subfamily)